MVLSGGGMCGFFQGECVWFFREGMCGFFAGGHACFFSRGACIGYDEIRSMSRQYASYWNAFLYFQCFAHQVAHVTRLHHIQICY